MTDAMWHVQQMISRLEDKVADQEKRISTLEKQIYLGTAVDTGRGSVSDLAAGTSAEIRKLEQEDATSRVIAKLEERKVDARCMDYWKTHPEAHLELVEALENEDLPPGRDHNRDESPYWMTRLKKHMETVHMRYSGGASKGYGKGKGKRSRSRSRDRYYR